MTLETSVNKKKSKEVIYSILVKFTLIILIFIIILFVVFQIFGSLVVTLGPEDKFNYVIIFVPIIIAIAVLLAIFEVLSIKEYRGYILKKPFYQRGKSYLTLENIFENENRMNILREILNNPGIHQNELLRQCNLNKGQLQWHLDILLKHHIIKKEKFGQYTIYFPITASTESIEDFKNLLLKSETSSKIYELIKKSPGISSSEISKTINLARNTVKYHIDKLSERNLIYFRGKGRKIELYPNLENFDS